MKRSLLRILTAVFILAGCASQRTFEEGQALVAEGRTEEGLARMEQALKEDPTNAQYRSYVATQRERVVNRLLAEAMAMRLNGRFDEALSLYLRAKRFDPNDRRIAAGIEALTQDRRHAALFEDAQRLFDLNQLDKARDTLRRVLAEDPRHRQARLLLRRIDEKEVGKGIAAISPRIKSRLTRPITLEFRDADIRAIFEVISRSSGINFIFDRDVRPDLKASIFVRKLSMEEALHLLLVSNQLDRRVVGDNTVLIYPNTPAKQRDYQELVVKSFYLNTADAKQTGNLMRTVLKVRDVFVDDRINMVVVRDTPEVIRLAEKLVAAQDLPEAESMLEVEVLEVSSTRLQNLGLQWPQQIGYGLLQGPTAATAEGATSGSAASNGTSVAQGVVDLHNKHGLTAYAANPLLLLDLHANDTLANVLANPRIRVKNREKAKILIGDRVPVITSTATATGFVSQSVTYLDVGIKLDVEPYAGLDDEVTMKVGLEVSNIVSQVTTSSGTVAFRVGTRSAGTTLRLKDGETQVLAGLIQDEDRRSIDKVPGLGDLPILGRLFSDHSDNHAKTEIVLLITPRVVRSLAFPQAGATEFTSGTESSVGRLGGGGGGEGAPAGGVEMAPPSPPPAAPTQPPATPPTGTAPPPAVQQPEAGGQSIIGPMTPPAPGAQ